MKYKRELLGKQYQYEFIISDLIQNSNLSGAGGYRPILLKT